MPFQINRRNRYEFEKWTKLAGLSVIVGFLSTLLALSLKHATEHFEMLLFERSQHSGAVVILFPVLGLSLIYFLRKQLFKGRANKGITEVLESLDSPKKLPLYKIPSHYINGFLTVISGGSTGIEVSTVVATAAIGSVAHKKQHFFHAYRKELMCAAIAAGVTALFNSPLAGIFFALEVITRKRNAESLLTMLSSTAVTTLILMVSGESRLLNVHATHWNYEALPFFMLLGIFGAVNSVYLMRCVLFCKKMASEFGRPMLLLPLGSLFVGSAIFLVPQLYGDSYHSFPMLFSRPDTFSITSIWLLFAVLIMKPIVVSVTLASGGDGGVFAPSLVIGAFAGFLFAVFSNHFFGTELIVLNFTLAGMAAVLSGSIHAPLTAVFLVCGLTGNYVLIFPLLLVCFVSKFVAQQCYAYNVYNYQKVKNC